MGRISRIFLSSFSDPPPNHLLASIGKPAKQREERVREREEEHCRCVSSNGERSLGMKQITEISSLNISPEGVSEVSRKNKKGGVIIPDDNIT